MLRIEAPARPGQALQGHYMLFVIDKPGVPSVAKHVRLNGLTAAATTTTTERFALRGGTIGAGVSGEMPPPRSRAFWLAPWKSGAQDAVAMRRSFAAFLTIGTLAGASAPAILAACCPSTAPHPCCPTDRSRPPGAQFTPCRDSCACDEVRAAPRAPVIMRDTSVPAPTAVIVSIVSAPHVWQIAPGLDLPPRPPDRSWASGPPLRLRI